MRSNAILVQAVGLLVLLNAVGFAAEPQPQVADLLAKMPGATVEEGRQAAAALTKLGPEALVQVAGMLVATTGGDDSKARHALRAVAYTVGRPGGERERAMVARALLQALDAAAHPQAKAFLIDLLQVAGKEEAVAPLGRLLRDPNLCEPAAQALIAIHTRGVVPELRRALAEAQGPNRVTIVKALGDLRARAAVKEIIPFATSDDANTRRAALYALANIGDRSAAGTLARAATVQAAYDRAQATGFLLAFARRQAESGRKRECARICRDLIEQRTLSREHPVVCSALAALASAVGKDALPDLMAALDSEETAVRQAALKLTQPFPGKAVTAKLVARLKTAPPELRADLIAALADRGDASALPAVLDGLQDAEKSVRLAAVDAAARFGGDAVVTRLIAALNAGDADEAGAIQAALLRQPGEQPLAAAAAALPKSSPQGRVALLQVLAARHARSHLEAVLTATEDAESTVRAAALKALGAMADREVLPRVIDLLVKAPDGPEAAEAQAAVVAICRQIAEADARAASVVAALGQATGEGRVRLLEVLPRVGGKQALQAASADAKSADANARGAAIRALAAWPDAIAAGDLLALAKSAESPDHRAVALRGYLRLAALRSERPAAETVRLYQDALALAPGVEERKLAVGGLAGVRDPGALKLVATCLDDPAVAGDAAAAAMRIILPRNDKEEALQGADVVEVVRKVAVVARDGEVRTQAYGYLATLPAADDRNLARGKPVTTSVATEGEHRPERAVDGNSRNRDDSSWWGANTPSWLRVDLGKAETIDTAHVFFYWDGGRYYQYTLDVSSDDQTWKTVVDQSGTTAPATPRGVVHTFAPVEARYVRINVLKGSANQAVHLVELKLYPPGMAPAAQPAPKPDAEGFVPLFNGKDLAGWTGSVDGYVAENGAIVCIPGKGGVLHTEEEYSDFHLKFEFRLPPDGNNGIGIRFGGAAGSGGMEIQVLDDTAEIHKNLQPYQYHGSIYGVVPAKRGHQKPVGEWNDEEIIANGRRVTVILNGVTIVDADLDEAGAKMADGHGPAGLKSPRGYIGFLGHGTRVEFRNLRIKDLSKK